MALQRGRLGDRGGGQGERLGTCARRVRFNGAASGRDSAESTDSPESKAPRRFGWASLLARVLAVDVMVCRKCGGRMRIFEVVDTPDAIARVLHGAHAPPRPPPPGQLLLLR